MPASRVIVSSPSTHGAIGFTTDLEPSMTLGCGSWGGNVTSDNISPRHLLDVKRIAFETHPINHPTSERPGAATNVTKYAEPAERSRVDVHAIEVLVNKFLAERDAGQPPQGRETAGEQTRPVGVASLSGSANGPATQQAGTQKPPRPPLIEAPPPVAGVSVNGHVHDFVCEDDVKRAVAAHDKIYINSKTIITPAARDLAEEHDVFSRVQ